MNTALLLVEIQNDYFANGRVPLEKSLEASMRAKSVLQAYREKKMPVIHVQHISTHPNAASHLPCTKGADFHPNVQPVKGEMIIKKHYPNSFKDTSLLNYLIKNQINHLVICGMMTHAAIEATVRAAYDLGFICTVLHDACATRALEFNHTIIPEHSVQYAFLAALQPQYATVLSTEDFIQRIGVHAPIATE
ncbi:MAG: cysteine hydrolase [Gammaproteobacteria bacterium]|nr:MAG: cysteine hydrolase [Gammaproteobacteria bacterium]